MDREERISNLHFVCNAASRGIVNLEKWLEVKQLELDDFNNNVEDSLNESEILEIESIYF